MIPNAEQAFVDTAKLRDYCLNPLHPRGKHKARIFQSRLGLNASDAEYLRDVLLGATLVTEVVAGEVDAFGRRYVLDVKVTTEAGTATVKSGWIVRTDEAFPRLVTCYVL